MVNRVTYLGKISRWIKNTHSSNVFFLLNKMKWSKSSYKEMGFQLFVTWLPDFYSIRVLRFIRWFTYYWQAFMINSLAVLLWILSAENLDMLCYQKGFLFGTSLGYLTCGCKLPKDFFNKIWHFHIPSFVCCYNGVWC